MNGRVRSCSTQQRTALRDGWEFAVGAGTDGKGIAGEGAGVPGAAPSDGWKPALVPGTAASGLRESGAWSLDAPARDFDTEEWWYRLRFTAAPAQAGERVVLGFEGLATFAEVWLNGEPLTTSDNMFLAQCCEVGGRLTEGTNELLIRFSPLAAVLKARRPRPRWRTPMVAHPQLRFVRTTLLGRTPGWSPPAAAVGPWRPVWIERQRFIEIEDLRLATRVVAGMASGAMTATAGVLTATCKLSLHGGATLHAAYLVAERDEEHWEVALTLGDAVLGAQLTIADVALWWPHTHGAPNLYRAALRLLLEVPGAGELCSAQVDLGRVGFRDLKLARAAGDFSLEVNGRPVFCRGACWTPPDVTTLSGSSAAYRDTLRLVRAAGMNMLRVGGTMVYEADEFLDLCDELGILVWQDFMFANMDYPAAEPHFHDSAVREARQQLARLQARPALAVLCGNSEGAQQAAMSGAPRECWQPPFFESELGQLAAEYCPGVPYTPSSAYGGAFPHQPEVGVTSYYGVGAYRLPVSDARRSAVRFASECLAFANIPDPVTLELLGRSQPLRVHHARWKERVPRDQGAGWDFDDVRDHYLSAWYGVDPVSLRYADHDRYLRMGRAVSGEVMAACFAEWRRPRSSCRGALVWFLKDLWPGAGWGVIDADGLPKAAYYGMKRALQPIMLSIADEGTNGLIVNIINDSARAQVFELELRLFHHSEPVGQPSISRVALAAASAHELSATDLFEGFVDLSYAFRFGPASYDVLHARLRHENAEHQLAETFYFPLGASNALEGSLGLSAKGRLLGSGAVQLRVQTIKFARSVHIEVPGFVSDDQFFHMAPNSSRVLHLEPCRAAAGSRPEGTVHCLNSAAASRIVFELE